MHVLRGLRREQAPQCLPELRWRFCRAADQAAKEWRPGVSVEKHPPSAKRVHLSFGLDDIAAHSARIRNIRPEDR
jgi:hypothetical protein